MLKTYTEFLLEIKSAITITDPDVQHRMHDLLITKPDDTDETRLQHAKDFFKLYRENAGKVKHKDIPKWFKDREKVNDKKTEWNKKANKPV